MVKIKVGLVEDKLVRMMRWVEVFRPFQNQIDFCLIAIPLGDDFTHIDKHKRGIQPHPALSIYDDILLVNTDVSADPALDIENIIEFVITENIDCLLVDVHIAPWDFSEDNQHGMAYNGLDIMERLLEAESGIILMGETAKKESSVNVAYYPFVFDRMFFSLIDGDEPIFQFLKSLVQSRESFTQPLYELFSPENYGKDKHYGLHHLTHKGGWDISPANTPWNFLRMSHEQHANFAQKAASDVKKALDREPFSTSSSKQRTICRLYELCTHFDSLTQENRYPWNNIPSWNDISDKRCCIRDMEECFPLNYKMAFRIGNAMWETRFSWLVLYYQF